MPSKEEKYIFLPKFKELIVEELNKILPEAMLKNDSIGMQVPQNMIDSDFDNLLKFKMQFYSDINLKQKNKTR